jgi:hypothetical protein
MTGPKLSPAQARMLDEVRSAGERTYNGRARRTVERLASLGLVTVEYDQIAQSKGSGIELVERFRVRPTL